MLARDRWLRGSGEAQTAHSQAIMGTPCDVPVPRKMISMVTPPPKLLPHPLASAAAWGKKKAPR
jgi:hypothetical protein